MEHREPADRLRLADLLAALSLESDLAMGHPPEEAMRTCLLATSLAREMGSSDKNVTDVYWTALLLHVGCTAFAHEQAALFGGDEITVNAAGSKTDPENLKEVLSFLLEVSDGMSLSQRGRLFYVAMTRSKRFSRDIATATCEVASRTAQRLDLPESVQRGLDEFFERWDGKGHPRKLRGEEIAFPARVAQFAAEVTVYDRLGGTAAAIEMARRRSGTALDPHISGVFVRHAPDLLEVIHAGDPWRSVVDGEPGPHRWIPASRVDEVARVFAELVDLKSTYTLGHSTQVARLAEDAGREMGLPDYDVACLRRAGYLHDLGKVGVPNGIWEKPGPLTTAEWEQVRLHPYHSERILSRSPVLASIAPIAGMHHERLDGSGYYRRATAASLPTTARVLAAADAYQGLTQKRAHRPALSPSAAADHLASEATEGRLDGAAVEAVLSAAGHEQVGPVRREWPRGLTDREVEVLRLVACGHSTREVGRRLYISPKTVGHHVEHIYQKLEVSSRAAAAVFAMQHDLLGESDQGPPSK